MEWPDGGSDIVDALYRQHRDLAEGSPDDQRVLTRMIGEQFAFAFGPHWGVKSADPSRPQGPSEIAFNGPPLLIWRWSDGDGHVTGVKGAPLPTPLLQPLDQSVGQHFIGVDAIDHLHRAVPDFPTPIPPPVPPNGEYAIILERLGHLEAAVTKLTEGVPALATQLRKIEQRPWPAYRGSYGIALAPDPAV